MESGPAAEGKREFNHPRHPDSAESTLGAGQGIAAELWQTITQAIKG